jgi:hypothetical protein
VNYSGNPAASQCGKCPRCGGRAESGTPRASHKGSKDPYKAGNFANVVEDYYNLDFIYLVALFPGFQAFFEFSFDYQYSHLPGSAKMTHPGPI